MSSVVSSVVSVTFGLLCNKLRSHTAEKLKEGDVTDEKFRKLIVRELDDIKSKLDGLARKDLLSSVQFLKEGMNRLQICVDGLTDDGNSSMAEPVQYEELPLASLNLGEAMTKLKITSEDCFKPAKESFKAAREEATRAFSNEALSTQDRIFATKLRITSSIMENLNNLKLAGTDGKMYLEELHDLPAIKEAFSVHLDGGIKSLFKKSKRLEIVQSVRMINSVLYDFTRRFTKMTPDLFEWPQIELEQRSYHPFTVDESIPLGHPDVGRLEALEFQSLGQFKIRPWRSAVNSKGEIITSFKNNEVSVINREGECRIFCSLPSEGTSVATGNNIKAQAVDEDDNVYIVSNSKATYLATGISDKYRFTLFVFDSNGNIKHQCSLDFLSYVLDDLLGIAVNKENKIAIASSYSSTVYICDDSGQLKLKAKFDLDDKYRHSIDLCCSDTNEIILGSRSGNTVTVYTEEGKLKRKIKLPEFHVLHSVAFNYITKNIVVFTQKSLDMYLLNYSETDTPQCLCLGIGDFLQFSVHSHPNGQVVLLQEAGIAYI